MSGRTIAIGDIHGCSIALGAVIAEFDPQPDDTLVTLGGYDPDLPLDQQDEASLFWEGIRGRVPRPHCSGKIAVVGHTSQQDGEILDAGHLVCLDTNCWDGEWLTAIDVQTRRVWQADEGGRLR